MPNEADWNAMAASLEGRTIVKARYMTKKEKESLYWSKSALVLRLDDGVLLIPMSDDEGNEAGALMALNGGIDGFPTL